MISSVSLKGQLFHYVPEETKETESEMKRKYKLPLQQYVPISIMSLHVEK